MSAEGFSNSKKQYEMFAKGVDLGTKPQEQFEMDLQGGKNHSESEDEEINEGQRGNAQEDREPGIMDMDPNEYFSENADRENTDRDSTGPEDAGRTTTEEPPRQTQEQAQTEIEQLTETTWESLSERAKELFPRIRDSLLKLDVKYHQRLARMAHLRMIETDDPAEKEGLKTELERHRSVLRSAVEERVGHIDRKSRAFEEKLTLMEQKRREFRERMAGMKLDLDHQKEQLKEHQTKRDTLKAHLIKNPTFAMRMMYPKDLKALGDAIEMFSPALSAYGKEIRKLERKIANNERKMLEEQARAERSYMVAFKKAEPYRADRATMEAALKFDADAPGPEEVETEAEHDDAEDAGTEQAEQAENTGAGNEGSETAREGTDDSEESEENPNPGDEETTDGARADSGEDTAAEADSADMSQTEQSRQPRPEQFTSLEKEPTLKKFVTFWNQFITDQTDLRQKVKERLRVNDVEALLKAQKNLTANSRRPYEKFIPLVRAHLLRINKGNLEEQTIDTMIDRLKKKLNPDKEKKKDGDEGTENAKKKRKK